MLHRLRSESRFEGGDGVNQGQPQSSIPAAEVAGASPGNAPAPAGARGVPLVVDLDGTLVATDLLLECLFTVARRAPLALLLLPWWLLHGIARVKRELARRAVPLGPMPFRQEVVAFLEDEKRNGSHLVLATAADAELAVAIARQVGLFDAVHASDGTTNLARARKRARLVEEYGLRGFDYVGSGRSDRAVWPAARRAILVEGAADLEDKAARTIEVERRLLHDPPPLRRYIASLRPHQWLKNAMVLIPLGVAQQLLDPVLFGEAALAFAAFSLCASGGYLLNDLLDLPADRKHPHKRLRPVASGSIPIAHATLLSPLLLMLGLAVAALLSWPFVAVLSLYCIVSIAYSIRLKDVPILDVLVLAGLNAARVVGGSAAVGIALSPWFLAFWFLLLFSIALTKRYAELIVMRNADGANAHARGYLLQDAELLAALGGATGIIAVLLLALYIDDVSVTAALGQQTALWLFCVLLIYWISYMWLMAHRGRMLEDPLAFALTDRTSRTLVLIMAFVLVAATFAWGDPAIGTGS